MGLDFELLTDVALKLRRRRRTIMAVNPSSGRGSSPPLSVFGPSVFVAFLANLDAMRLLGRLVYDTAVPGPVEGLAYRTSMHSKRGVRR